MEYVGFVIPKIKALRDEEKPWQQCDQGYVGKCRFS